MKWHLHAKFAMPGVIALFFVAVFQEFIPPNLRSLAFASVALTLVLGLLTGQFHQIARRKKEKQPSPNTPQPDCEQEDKAE